MRIEPIVQTLHSNRTEHHPVTTSGYKTQWLCWMSKNFPLKIVKQVLCLFYDMQPSFIVNNNHPWREDQTAYSWWLDVNVARYGNNSLRLLLVVVVCEQWRNYFFTKKLSFVKRDEKRSTHYSSLTAVFANVCSNWNCGEKSSLNLSKNLLLGRTHFAKRFIPKCSQMWRITLYTLFAFRTNLVHSFLFHHCSQIVCSERNMHTSDQFAIPFSQCGES